MIYTKRHPKKITYYGFIAALSECRGRWTVRLGWLRLVRSQRRFCPLVAVLDPGLRHARSPSDYRAAALAALGLQPGDPIPKWMINVASAADLPMDSTSPLPLTPRQRRIRLQLFRAVGLDEKLA